MTYGLLALLVKSGCDISQSSSSSNYCCLGRLVDSDAVEISHIDDEVAVFSTKTVGCIAVSAGFCGDLDAIGCSAGHSILDMSNCLRHSIRGWLESHTKIEWLEGLGVVRGS